MEFDLIRQFFLPLSASSLQRSSDLAIGDDGAIITPPSDCQLVVVTDTLVEGVHFPLDTLAYDIGWKALAVNLSDLAAMGAKPAFYSLALTLPKVDQAWLSEFSKGLADCAAPYEIPLIGGDTTRGPLTITVTAQGWVPKGQALLRSGAKPGDAIFVSGLIGEAGRGLSLALAQQGARNLADNLALARLNRPQAQVALGCELIAIAHSAIDISDGLLADLGHILEASGVGASLVFDTIPLSNAVKEWAGNNRLRPLCAGDDYELCFTASADKQEQVYELAKKLDIKLCKIGVISQQPGLLIDGMQLDLEKKGYDHF